MVVPKTCHEPNLATRLTVTIPPQYRTRAWVRVRRLRARCQPESETSDGGSACGCAARQPVAAVLERACIDQAPATTQ
jgi:hypothetical protein